MVLPRVMERKAGAAETLKSAAGFTVSDGVAEWTSAPLVPVMVILTVPAVAPEEAVKVKVEVPEPLMEEGLKLGVTPEGNPVTARFTVPVKPFSAPMVTV